MRFYNKELDVDIAGSLVISAFFLYAVAVGLGAFGCLSRSLVFVGLFFSVLAVWRMRLFCGAGNVLKKGVGGIGFSPVLHWLLLFSFLTILLSPGAGGDGQVYHLPSISYMLKTGSTVSFQPSEMYRSAAITTYYPRGFEALCSVFYQFPASRIWIVFFKSLLFFGVFFLFLDRGKNRTVATSLFVFLLSMQFVRDDLGNLKNDLTMAVPLLYAATMVLATQPKRSGIWIIPLACALSLSIKASVLLYAAPVLLMWLWIYRQRMWTQVFCVIGIVIPFGLYFYWVNWIQTGNPLFPFEVSFWKWTLFDGQETFLMQTSIFMNLDVMFPLLFFRGLLRATGPFGVLFSVVLSIALLKDAVWKRVVSKHWKMWVLLFVWGAGFLMTPFSDHNGSIVHNQLYSGTTIRMAFPVILLAFFLFSDIASVWIGDSDRKGNVLVSTFAVASILNLFWYDAVCLVFKPENALAHFAPILKTFDLWRLTLFVLLLAVLCVIAVVLKKRWVAVVLVLLCVGIQQVGYPNSMGYTMRFKQMGQSSDVFEFLCKRDWKEARVAIHSADESSFFLACVNDYLLPRTKRMQYAEALDNSIDVDWLILCAKDSFGLSDSVRGRRYRVSWEFLDLAKLDDEYVEVFRDDYYRIYNKDIVVDGE